jgi:hypothetical protein
LGNTKVRGAVEQTKWCINKQINMRAMPLWGHTVKWYCSITKDGGAVDLAIGAPPFANIPQHDIDHNSKRGYTKEIEDDMKRIACDIQDSDHKLKGESLVTELNNASNAFGNELTQRGIRKDGTHNAWRLALKENPDPQWVHPFSMASDKRVSEVSFPARNFDNKLSAWIERLAKAIAGT